MNKLFGWVAKLVDAPDSKSGGHNDREGSTPSLANIPGVALIGKRRP